MPKKIPCPPPPTDTSSFATSTPTSISSPRVRPTGTPAFNTDNSSAKNRIKLHGHKDPICLASGDPGTSGVLFTTFIGQTFCGGAVISGNSDGEVGIDTDGRHELFFATLNIPADDSIQGGTIDFGADDIMAVTVNGNYLATGTYCTQADIPANFLVNGNNSFVFNVWDNCCLAGPDNTLDLAYSICVDVVQTTPTFSPTGTITPLTPTPSQTETDTPSVTPTPTNCSPLAHPIALQSYKQSGQSWSGIPMPNNSNAKPGNTIGSIGCFLTCFSMMDGRDPDQLDTLFTNNGYISNDGDFIGWESALVFQVHNIIFQNFWKQEVVSDPTETFDLSSDVATAALQPENEYIIAEAFNTNTGKTHFFQVVAATMNPNTGKCDYSIYDPSSRNYSYFSQYNGEGTNSNPWEVYCIIPIGAN